MFSRTVKREDLADGATAQTLPVCEEVLAWIRLAACVFCKSTCSDLAAARMVAGGW
eukprot:SAG11_NODE_2361_length_3462_cov_2.031519_2_plen_56_part_00